RPGTDQRAHDLDPRALLPLLAERRPELRPGQDDLLADARLFLAPEIETRRPPVEGGALQHGRWSGASGVARPFPRPRGLLRGLPSGGEPRHAEPIRRSLSEPHRGLPFRALG